MSILITGIDMPTSCYDCNFSVEAYEGSGVYACVITDNCVCKGAGMRDDCPLVPVPPHGRLGDLDELERDFREDAKGSWNMRAMPMNWADAFEEVADIVADAPTIIEAEDTNKEATNDQNNS